MKKIRTIVMAVTLLALLTTLSVEAAAAQDDTLVSNADQTAASTTPAVGNVGGTTIRIAQEVRTGTNFKGYTITRVSMLVSGYNPSTERARVRIHADGDDGTPGVALYTLVTPTSIADGRIEFTAPRDTVLERNTTYHVVVENTNNNLFGLGATASTDLDRRSGWLIQQRRDSRDNGDWTNQTNRVRLSIHGTEGPWPETCTDDGDHVRETPACIEANLIDDNSIQVRLTEPQGNNSTLRLAITTNLREGQPLYRNSDLTLRDLSYYVYGWNLDSIMGAQFRDLSQCNNSCTIEFDNVTADGYVAVNAFIGVAAAGKPTKWYFLSNVTRGLDQQSRLQFESNYLGDCQRGRNQDGQYWKFSYLNDDRSNRVNSVELQDDGIVDCMGIDGLLPDRNEEPDRIWQAQICERNSCTSPMLHNVTQNEIPIINVASGNSGTRSRWTCFDQNGNTKRNCTFAEVASTIGNASPDADNTSVNVVFQESHLRGSIADFHDAIAPAFEDRPAGRYAILTVCDGLVCRRSQAVEERNMAAAAPLPVADPPSAPRSLSVRVSNDAVMTTTWSTPSSAGTAPITGYTVAYKCSEHSTWRHGGQRSAGDRRYEHSIREYLRSSDCETSSTLDARIQTHSQDGDSPWANSQANIPDAAKEQEQEAPPADSGGESGTHSSPSGTPPSGDEPVTATVNAGNTRITVMFDDPDNTKCQNYYVEAWGSVGHLHRVTHTDGAGEVTLSYSKRKSSKSGDKTRIDVLCGTFTGDDGRRWAPGVITEENPNGSGQRWLGSVAWYYD